VASSGHRLKSPPIVEALIEIRALYAVPLELSHLDQFRYKVADAYPTCERQIEWTARVGAANNASTSTKEVGFILRSKDTKYVVQARIDGLRVSRLAPYNNWEDFLAETLRLWKIYVAVATPAAIARLGVRYINQIVLPTPLEPGAYFKTRPEVGQGLQQAVGDFFFRVEIPVPPLTTVILTQMSDRRSSPPGKTTLILDIDTFRVGQLAADSLSLPAELEALREIKNTYFYGSITEKVIELAGGEG
jgi:uncharacterized protein (TIGR04255 family)